MNVLCTGATGSGGSYLCEYILANHPEVNLFGLHRWKSTGTLTNIENFKDEITLLECDLLDLSSVIRSLNIAHPDKVFHLAAFAKDRKSTR